MERVLYYYRVMSELVCLRCGNTNIEVQVWVKPNHGNEIVDLVDDNKCWCSDCIEMTKFEVFEDEES